MREPDRAGTGWTATLPTSAAVAPTLRPVDPDGDHGTDLGLPGYGLGVPVARGGGAWVYQAVQCATARVVAIKTLPPGRRDAAVARALEREARLLAAVGVHRGVVRLVASGSSPAGVPFVATEFCFLGSFGDRLMRGPLPWPRAVGVGVQLAGAVEWAHRAGIVHGDIKPENVLRTRRDRPKLADFGSARPLDDDGAGAGEGEGEGEGEGSFSVPFAAPERFDGAPSSVSADVYSVACTVVSLILGRPCFLPAVGDLPSALSLMARIGREPPPDLGRLGVPGAVCAVLDLALAKEPGRRPPSAARLGQGLKAAAVLTTS